MQERLGVFAAKNPAMQDSLFYWEDAGTFL